MTDRTLSDWQQYAANLTLPHQAYLNGEFCDAASGATFAAENPATGEVLTHIAACQAEDVDRAVALARRTFNAGTWRDLAPTERKARMLDWAALIEDHLDEIALLETLETGKPISQTTSIDVPGLIGGLRFYAEALDKLYGETAPNGPDSVCMIDREPVGVVAAVVPWNYPLIIAGWKIGPALGAGNSLIIKPAEQSSLATLRVAALAREAGIPEGAFQVVTGLGHQAGEALGRHMDIDAVGFTGSTEIGKRFLAYSAESNMKRIGLECGGKSPHIVTRDVEDLDKIAMNVAYGVWYNQGQTCHAGTRLIVDRQIKEALLERLEIWAEKLQPGDPLAPDSQIGAMIEEPQLEKVREYLADGQREGARLRFGGERARHESGGYYMTPAILDEVTNDMRVAREEIFGPVLVVLTHDEVDEALAIANDTDYGLGAAIWTRNLSDGHRAARALRAGTVWVNCYDHTSINAPFGGFKQSGQGRDKSLHAFDKYTELKTTWIEI
ncbi:gamma-glutamyl-gamma-aminobutyraldehyde dehydrogenase [Onishia taeanensis]|uniref:Gamma-glutamyl-gamma-aminobutyraldehyde dehydrogenase n=1 Tax=Onishia taeanensis TaxID=284577 RepID=A0A328Y1T3_9GAMM|nr:aldehyde dehydrogenase [Halomonas taeanensis]RAR63028.1 gamma-glutamyl-gamma-aminobutyraldehyde dehydrogenase [Halomonas taeanensis]